MTFDSTRVGYTKDYNFSWKTKPIKTKLDISYTSLRENRGLKEVCNYIFYQVSALGNTNAFTEVKKQVPANVMNLI